MAQLSENVAAVKRAVPPNVMGIGPVPARAAVFEEVAS